MKVLMFGWEFPPHNSGGLGVACQGLAKALGQYADLIFVLPKKLDIKPNGKFKLISADIENISLKFINSTLIPYITSEKYYGLNRNKKSVYGRTLFEEVERYAELAGEIAKKESFDIIHAHDWLSFGAGINAKKASGKPLVAHIHATEIDRTGGNINKQIYEKEKEGLEYADRIISVSEFTKNILLNHYQIPSEKIEVVHNGIDLANYTLSANTDLSFKKLKSLGFKIVLFVGRITIMKGPDYFVRAAQKVLKHNPKTLFVMVGSGDMEGQIIDQVAKLGISDKFFFTGFLRGADLSKAFKAADLFVMPSISEPFGLTALESLIHKTPAIVSKQSGVSEVLNQVMKVDFWDTDEMADKILSVLKYKSLHKEMSTNGEKEAAFCSWESAAQKCINIYNKLAINH